MTKLTDKAILDRDDKHVDDRKVIDKDDSWMDDHDVLNIKFDTWRRK